MVPWLLSGKQRQHRLILVWRVIWIGLLFFGEWLVFRQSVRQCSFAHHATPLTDDKPERVALIADPQITDFYSYDRSPLLLWLTQKYSDLYMRRSYGHLLRHHQPDLAVFVGDLMDGGREWKDNEGWVLEKNRFFRLFPRQDRMVEQYTSGNHDIGISTGIQRSVYERFRRSFGPLSAIHPLAHNHSLVVLDTVALTSADELIRLEALQVLAQWHPQSAASLTPDSAAQQTMLVSHVPLYRPDQTSCGPLRTQSRPSIYQRYGYQYQNLLEAPLTTKLLEFVQPDLVFSGDDHDFCQVTHDYRGTGAKQRQATEYTVPTFSMAQGVRRPGYMLVQAMPDQLAPQLCWLPDQLRIYMVYGWAALATLLCLLGSRFWAGHDRTNRAVRLDRLKRDDDDADDVLPTANPASSSAQPIPKQPHMALFLSTARDLQQVAIVAVPFYIFCILCL